MPRILTEAQKQFEAAEAQCENDFKREMREAFDKHDGGWVTWLEVMSIVGKYWDGRDFGTHVVAGHEAKQKARLEAMNRCDPDAHYTEVPLTSKRPAKVKQH